MGMTNAHTQSPARRGGYLNFILTVNAVALGVLLFTQAHPASAPALSLGSTALAGPPEETDLNARVSAAEQRKEMIAELRNISQRLSNIEGRFKGALPVKVVEMPREAAAQRPAPVPQAAPSK